MRTGFARCTATGCYRQIINRNVALVSGWYFSQQLELYQFKHEIVLTRFSNKKHSIELSFYNEYVLRQCLFLIM